jgi:hypothetical protein
MRKFYCDICGQQILQSTKAKCCKHPIDYPMGNNLLGNIIKVIRKNFDTCVDCEVKLGDQLKKLMEETEDA